MLLSGKPLHAFPRSTLGNGVDIGIVRRSASHVSAPVGWLIFQDNSVRTSGDTISPDPDRDEARVHAAALPVATLQETIRYRHDALSPDRHEDGRRPHTMCLDRHGGLFNRIAPRQTHVG